jgi:hypothetical protein
MERNFARNAAIALLSITTTFFAYGASAQRAPMHGSPAFSAPGHRPSLRTPDSRHNFSNNFDREHGFRNDKGFNGRPSPYGNRRDGRYNFRDPRVRR